jgi:hypothetical protein
MKCAQELLRSPDFCPLEMDFDNGTVSFVPMSRATYKPSSFLDAAQMSDAERAAHSSLGRSPGLTLAGEEISDAPAGAVRAVADHFGLRVRQGLPKNIFCDATVARHAKDQSLAYDARSRHQELKTSQKQIGAEADRGVEWAAKHWVLFGGRP